MKKRYLVLIEKGETSYGAYAPDVPGCVAVGKTAEETLKLFREALQFHFDDLLEEGQAVPQASYVAAEFAEVEVPSELPAVS